MKIEKATNAFKIATVKYNNSTKLDFIYETKLKSQDGKIEYPQSILTKNLARVYIIVVNGIIKKIGGSQDKGGMKHTLQIYRDGGTKGRPSIRSFGIWYFLFHEILDKKSKIEFYMIFQDDFETEVKGLNTIKRVTNASINYKLLEEACIEDFHIEEGASTFPDWNVQEQGGDWPLDIKTAHSILLQKSTKKETKNGRKVINN